MAEIALRMDGVSKKFRKGEIYDSLRDLIPALTGKFLRRSDHLEREEFWALQDVSFEVERGEAFGIIGPNGAGKSTILKLMSGIFQPTRGSLQVNGTLSALIEVGAGFHPDLTGRENIYLNGAILGMRREEIAAKFDQIVEFSGLSEFLDTPVKRYSSGMYARLGFSVAAHVDPDVLVVDEVLSVGDLVFQRRCLQRMSEILTSGATVLFVSHNLHAVAELCSRSLLLEKGKVAMIGPSSEVISEYLTRASGSRRERGGPVEILGASLWNEAGERLRFMTGETVTVEVELIAHEAVRKVAVVLDVLGEDQYELFSTSTERLGEAPVDLAAGERLRCRFQLQLHLAQGSYRLAAHAHRYDLEKSYDSLVPACTFYVSSDISVRGAVNCHPRLLEQLKFEESRSSGGGGNG